MATETTTDEAAHTAWRFIANSASPLYVQGVHRDNGDRYSYTPDAAKAKKLTAHQCRLFCSYMRECSSVGFWS